MTTTFLSNPQQTALQQALLNSKLLNNCTTTSNDPPSSEQHAYSNIAVTLYRFNLKQVTWPSFLTIAITTVADACPWLSSELIRCQQNYQTEPNDVLISEQSAFFNGIFSEELAYIASILGTEVQSS